MQVQAIIPAAGAGLHQGESSAKVLLPVGGRTLIRRTLEAFDRCPEITGITLLISQRNLLEVTRELDSDGWRKAIDIRLGGERRQDSVRIGLESLRQDPPDFVIVHDGARPLVSDELIHAGLEAARQHGAATAAKIINALIKSASWPDSALILTYDEGGGLYDHVRPAREIKPDSIAPKLAAGSPGDFNESGFRLPVIVFSPWVKPSFVSHTTRDYTSILRLIEDRFNVPPLTLRDANADDMMEFFDFSGAAPLLTPPILPPQPINGACDKTLEAAPGF